MIALRAYEAGWAAKGWPVGNPLVGVPFWLRQALLALAQAEGAEVEGTQQDRRPSGQPSLGWAKATDLWPEALYAEAPEWHPLGLSPRHGWHRLLGPFLQAAWQMPRSAQILAPLTVEADGEVLQLSAEALLSARVPPELLLHGFGSGAPQRLLCTGRHRWLILGPVSVRLWSIGWLAKLERLIGEGQRVVRIRLQTANALPLLALWDALELLEATRQLYGLQIKIPEVVVQADHLTTVGRQALAAYRGKVDEQRGRSVLHNLALGPVMEPHLSLGDPLEFDDVDFEVEWRPSEVVTESFNLLQRAAQASVQRYTLQDAGKEVLDHFLARFLGHPSLRAMQYASMARILAGESILALLPTGYGKSVIFQLLALIQPATALVICPLLSLMRDQVDQLRQHGIRGVGYIAGNELANRADIISGLAVGRYRLLYLTPERLETGGFQRAIGDAMPHNRFSLIVVDEAHCVSEWGHDFRPAYARIGSLRERLQGVPLVGLTATASSVVLGHTLRLLGLLPEQVVQSRASDRPELSYSVHIVRGSRRRAREKAIGRLVNHVVPRILGLGPAGLLGSSTEGVFEHGTVVFTPFADAHSEALYTGGAAAVAESLRPGVLGAGRCSDIPLIGVHASTAPAACPRCGSVRFYVDRRSGFQDHCTVCGAKWLREQRRRPARAEWDSQQRTTQQAFLSSALPVVVATKGLGMGIDKPNIRLIIHNVMSGGLEAYYQEAGRAGRDKRHAHVALVTVLPARLCISRHMAGGRLWRLDPDEPIGVPCLRRGRAGHTLLRCPYGRQSLCDIAQQAFLITASFPGAQQEWEMLKRVFSFSETGSFSASRGEANAVAKALVRLEALGVHRGYERVCTGSHETFHVRENLSWTWHLGCTRLLDYVTRQPRIPGVVSSGLRRAKRLWGEGGSREVFVESAGRIMIESLYTSVRAARLFSLFRLYRYATLKRGQCRRAFLRSCFELKGFEKYRCGFCDNCVPSMRFGRDRAIAFEGDLERSSDAAVQAGDTGGGP